MLRQTREQTLLSSLFSSTWEDFFDSMWWGGGKNSRWTSHSFAIKEIDGSMPREPILNILLVNLRERAFPSWSQHTGGTVSRSTSRLKTKHFIRRSCSLIQYLCVNHDGLFIHDIFKQAAVPGSCDLSTQIRKRLVTGAHVSTVAETFLKSCLPSHLFREHQFIENNRLFSGTTCIVLRSLSSTLGLRPVAFLLWTDSSNGLSCKPYGMTKSLFSLFITERKRPELAVRVQLWHSHMA